MIKRILLSKLFLLFLSLLIIGFFIGYDYSVLTSRYQKPAYTNNSNQNNVAKTITRPATSEDNEEQQESTDKGKFIQEDTGAEEFTTD